MLLIPIIFLFLNQPCSNYDTSKKNNIGHLEFKISYINSDPKNNSCLNTKISIVNNTDTAASFFEDWNLWGWYNIYFRIKTDDAVYILYKKGRDFDKNYPSYKTLFPGDSFELRLLLSNGQCDSTQFEYNSIKFPIKPVSIKAYYKLDKDLLESAELKGEIKYKYNYIPDRWIIIDSLKNPVEINKTFPTIELQSQEYHLSN